MKVLEVHEVSKNYLNKRALDGLNLEFEKGKIAGLLGPNGSGKTTLLKMISGLVKPSKGTIKVCDNLICYKTKEIVAYLPDSEFLYPWMKISDAKNLYQKFFADFNANKFDELLQFMKLDINSNFKSLSKGMKEKLALALTLSREAKLIILDEPLNGVDPVAREMILGAILKGFNVESSMLITSHLVNEIEGILDEAFFIKEGKIVYSTDIDTLREEKNMTLDDYYREVFAC